MDPYKSDEINSCLFMTHILENMQDLVRVIDKKGKVMFMNKVMREQFGDLVGKKCYEAINKTQKCVDCISEKSLEFLKSYNKEEAFESSIYSVVSSPVFNESTNQVYSVEVFRDITEQKEMEKKVYEQYSKMKADLNFAKHLQNKIIPENAIYGDCINVTAKYEPSEFLGGDIFDIFEIDNDHVGIYIADVSGHGVSASMFTMFLRQVMRNRKNKKLSIKETINDLIRNYKELNVDVETYFTVLYGIYNKSTGIITFVNAGHNCYPVILRNTNEIEEVDIKGFPICSLISESSHKSVKIKLNKGDRVFLYTDGIVEAYQNETNQFFGYERVYNLLKDSINQSDEGIISTIYQQVKSFAAGNIKDDIAMVIFEII